MWHLLFRIYEAWEKKSIYWCIHSLFLWLSYNYRALSTIFIKRKRRTKRKKERSRSLNSSAPSKRKEKSHISLLYGHQLEREKEKRGSKQHHLNRTATHRKGMKSWLDGRLIAIRRRLPKKKKKGTWSYRVLARVPHRKKKNGGAPLGHMLKREATCLTHHTRSSYPLTFSII